MCQAFLHYQFSTNLNVLKLSDEYVSTGKSLIKALLPMIIKNSRLTDSILILTPS